MYLDVAMPLTLFLVTMLAMLLNEKVEGKLKTVFEEKKFRVQDAILLVAAVSIMVSIVVFIPHMMITGLFLFAYFTLLFLFTYLFSNIGKGEAEFFFAMFSLVSFAFAFLSLFSLGAKAPVGYGAVVFLCLCGFSFLALLYEQCRVQSKERWYMAVFPPTMFINLYLFFSQTPIWVPYLLDFYGTLFAVLVTLHLSSLFTWKTTILFTGFITVMDIILVLVAGSMVTAATHVSALRLPVMVYMPIFPMVGPEMLYISLGLGDFLFAGLLAIQTSKKFGKNFAVLSVVAMTVSFFLFEMAMLNYGMMAFPGTLMILSGWAVLILFKFLLRS
ncbi:MAG: hypothetical protein QW468_04595 [Candidatus Bathyarchaeia archaeon]